MSDLFIDLYLDEDVDVLLKDLLAARGFDVLTTSEAGQISASDNEQLAFAARLDRAIVTHNRIDFENLAKEYFDNSTDHAGIIIARRRDVYEIARRLLVILQNDSRDEMKNQLRYI